MKKNEVVIGKTYRMKVSGKMTRVRVNKESVHGGWYGTNVLTNREVRIHTAQKLRYEVDPNSPIGYPAMCKYCGGVFTTTAKLIEHVSTDHYPVS